MTTTASQDLSMLATALNQILQGSDPTKSPPNVARQEALTQLAKLGGQLDADEDVVFSGKKFILPERVNLRQGIAFLQKKADEDEQQFAMSRVYNHRMMDGARATGNAIKKAFGFTLGKPIHTFFGTNPPELRDIKTSINTTEQVPWGAVAIPGLDDTTIFLGGKRTPEYGVVFQVEVHAPRKYRYEIEGLLRLIEEELQTNSIYRGQAIDGQETPEFLDLSGVDPTDVVYAEDVMQQLEANVWSPIQHAEALAKRGQPGKRAVLLEGPYGSGKTLGAFLTAQVAVKHGWTFVYCRPGKDDVDACMQTARLYQPSVMFYEDLDNLATPGADEGASKMLDMFDGIQAKGLNMLLVMTTNHVESLHKGMMRPGRLDAVIHIGEMTRSGVERLAHRVMGDALEDDIDFDAVFTSYDGFMPAFVREALDRTVRYSIARNDGKIGRISTSDLVLAADGLRAQLDLMNGAADKADPFTIDNLVHRKMLEALNGTQIIDPDNNNELAYKLAVPNGTLATTN